MWTTFGWAAPAVGGMAFTYVDGVQVGDPRSGCGEGAHSGWHGVSGHPAYALPTLTPYQVTV
jgi:hypothetical protein